MSDLSEDSDLGEDLHAAGPSPVKLGEAPAAQGGPTADRFVDELVIGLEQAADGESDPAIKSRLRGAAAVLATVGRHVAAETAAAVIVRSMDL